jgi:hypothetical protein
MMTTLAKGIGGLAIASTILAGCGGSGELSGNLFLATEGGQPKRGADVEVLLVPVTGPLQSELAQLESDYGRDIAPVKQAYEEAKRTADSLYKELMSSQRVLSPSASDSGSIEQARKDALARLEQLRRDASARASARDSWLQASRFAIEQAMKVDEVRSRYRERVVSLFRQHGARSTRTGVDGAYVFNDVPSGTVLVFAQWNTRELIGTSWFDVPHVWLLPIEVKRGANRLDLSGSNSGGAFWRR